jgi:hypothetical protein
MSAILCAGADKETVSLSRSATPLLMKAWAALLEANTP